MNEKQGGELGLPRQVEGVGPRFARMDFVDPRVALQERLRALRGRIVRGELTGDEALLAVVDEMLSWPS